ncbi:carboxylating nicotinate-nucleotide diphosphorylase [Orrella daihaiensis]|uniref:nicotinate-nucleotide diphosphorylase (carboxylating) n=1 Tax=Orrella daihaiensis TaxID=2782176 RepID=A0ABY4AIM1_9BURK|nr:carboxylating nicotinate-nucleotide diphosphorylase [Orrella daihaiensis]UOD50143.1 carboxylating nicotinate-nucleotide diphosphorylase [Orrella daihaiensis]
MYDSFQADRLIDFWLHEDIGQFDLTAQLMLDEDAISTFHMVAREPMIVAGIKVAERVFTRYDDRLKVTVLVKDGQHLNKGDKLLTVSGPSRSIVTAERPALNILQRLCGIASETARYCKELEGTKARLLDTRKTTPGLRMLEKHAVTCGGGLNHRLGLDNGVMLKDNHIAIAGSIGKAVERVRQHLPALTKIEVECDRLDQVAEALAAGADVIMLDNMSLEDMRTAVKTVNGAAKVEASGGINIKTIREVALTGVDFISTSKITQAAPAVDIGLDE